MIIKSICISGSKHYLAYWGEDKIQIGCKKYTISEWQELYNKIGINEGYTAPQIIEYKSYIDMIIIAHKQKLFEPIKK